MNNDRIKDIVLFLLLSGGELSKTNLIYTLTELADLSKISGEDDFKEDTLCKEFTNTVIFVNTSVEFFLRAKNDESVYDEWLDFYKNELVKVENYSLILELEL